MKNKLLKALPVAIAIMFTSSAQALWDGKIDEKKNDFGMSAPGAVGHKHTYYHGEGVETPRTSSAQLVTRTKSAGGSCGSNGQLAKSSTGELMSCVSGKWKDTSEVQASEALIAKEWFRDENVDTSLTFAKSKNTKTSARSEVFVAKFPGVYKIQYVSHSVYFAGNSVDEIGTQVSDVLFTKKLALKKGDKILAYFQSKQPMQIRKGNTVIAKLNYKPRTNPYYQTTSYSVYGKKYIVGDELKIIDFIPSGISY